MSQQVTEEFGKMTALLNEMEAKGEVDLSIITNIDQAMSTLGVLESLMSTNTSNRDVRSAFLGYHIIRNMNLILTKMRERFHHAKKNHDNPIVAEDSLLVLPLLGESLDIAMKYGGTRIGQGEEELMLSHILKLRDITAQVNMALSLEEETKTISVSEEVLQAEEKKLSDAVKQYYTKEEDLY